MGQKGSKVVVQGEVAAGYESVREMFQENFEWVKLDLHCKYMQIL